MSGAVDMGVFDPEEMRRRNLALANGIIQPPGTPMPGSPSAQDIATDQAAEAGAQPAPAAAAAPTPADLVAMLKDKGTRAALSSNSSTTTKVSKESKAAGKAEVAAIEAEKPIADQQQQIGEDNAQAQQDAATGNVLAIQQQQRDQAALAVAHDEIRAKKQAALDDAIQAHAAATPGDFWASQPDGARVQGAIAVALGQLGAGLQSMGGGNGHNAALDILNRRQDQFYALQKEKIDHAKDNVLMARAGVKDADEARQIAQTTLGAKYILGLEATKAQLAQGLAAQGKSQAEVDAALKKAGLDEKIAALRVQLTTPTNTQVTSSFNGTAALGALDGAVAAGRSRAGAGKEDKSEVFDKNRKLVGFTTSGKGGAQAFMTRDAQTTEAIEKAEALLKDVEGGSSTNIVDTHRKGLIAGATGAAATTSPLGKTNEAQELEAKMMGITPGPLGTSYVNADVLRSRIAQMKETQQNYRAQGLIPPTPEQSATWDARQAASPVNHGSAAPAAHPQTSEAEAWLTANPNDPRAGAVRAKLAAMGQ